MFAAESGVRVLEPLRPGSSLVVHWDPHVRGAVRLAPGNEHRRFVSRNQSSVGVRDRVRDGAHRPGVLEQSSDVVPARLAELGVRVARVEEGRFALRPQRLVGVHPDGVVAVDRFRHQAADLAVPGGDVPDNVSQVLDVVRHWDKVVKAQVDLGLAGGRDLVVVRVQSQMEVVRQDVAHLRAQGQQRVVWGSSMIPFLEPHGAAHGSSVPRRFRVVDEVAGASPGVADPRRRGDELDRIEDEELDLGTPVGVVVPGGREHLLGLPGNPPRIVRVRLLRPADADVADEPDRPTGLGIPRDRREC